jgi:multidrug efflux pump subunit AcrB
VVFGLTLAVNLLFGYTINRVTLFALILSLGLLVDDPIVDVENITRHFAMRRRATRQIVVEAVSEIRPPLITATLAVIVSFLPLFFITGMMGPYMRPMALNVPVTMLMSMLVAFTITPWLSYHFLKRRYAGGGAGAHAGNHADKEDPDQVRSSPLYRVFAPLMTPLLRSRWVAWGFLGLMGLLMIGAAGLAAVRAVPLKMLPFDNKNELLLVLDFDEGITLERSDTAVRELERTIAGVPEVTSFVSYVGAASPMDFNGLVRHYYLRAGPHVAEIRINLVGKRNRQLQSHGLGLAMRDELTRIANRHGANLKIVELPPGPPVISTITAEIRGQPNHTYEDLIEAAKVVHLRLKAEPGVVDVDDTVEADTVKHVFAVDKEKAALSGCSVEEIAETVRTALAGATAGIIHREGERHPLRIELRLPRRERSSRHDLTRLNVKCAGGALVPVAELGEWRETTADKTIYRKNLRPIVYVFAETAGRPPADCIVDILADQGGGQPPTDALWGPVGSGEIQTAAPRPVDSRTFLSNGGQVGWRVPEGIEVEFAGEGEWQITLDVFRDLGLAFVGALIGIYILLVAQMRSFVIPVVVMMAIPLTVIGIMPGFWLLNLLAGGSVGGYADPVFFTATGMIGMIALSGIVTRQAVIIIDFVHLSLRRGQSLFDAIVQSCVVRLRPILLTVLTAMLSAAPIAIDPIFSGLAWALIFGLFASTVFTLFVIPVVYSLLYERRPGHGLPIISEDE